MELKIGVSKYQQYNLMQLSSSDQPQRTRPYSISPFLKNTKLASQLHNNCQLCETQQFDIIITRTAVRILYLSLSYHSKFPRYLQNKIKEVRSKNQQANIHIYVLLLLDVKDTNSWFLEVQKAAIVGDVNLLWGDSVEDLRECLEELRGVYGDEPREKPRAEVKSQ